MDTGIKVEFRPYQTMYVPEALVNKFHDLMRGVEFVNSEYIPGQAEDKYERMFIEGDLPNIEFCEQPAIITSKADYEEMRAVAKAAKEAEEEEARIDEGME